MGIKGEITAEKNLFFCKIYFLLFNEIFLAEMFSICFLKGLSFFNNLFSKGKFPRSTLKHKSEINLISGIGAEQMYDRFSLGGSLLINSNMGKNCLIWFFIILE